MTSSKIVKQTAKDALKGKYLSSVVFATVFMFVFLSCSLISSAFIMVDEKLFSGIPVILSFFIVAPAFLGILKAYWRMIMGTVDDVTSIFCYFSSISLYRSATNFLARLYIRFILYVAVASIPAIITETIISGEIFEEIGISMPLWLTNFEFVPPILLAVGITISILAIIRYFPALMIFVADEEISNNEIIKISPIIAKGQKLSIILLFLSLIVYIVATMFILPAIFTLPILLFCYLVKCRFAVARYNEIYRTKFY